MHMYICLEFEGLFSHLPVTVLLRKSMCPTLSGSTSEHGGFNDSIDFHRHCGLESHGSNKHRGYNKFHHLQHRSSHKYRGFTKHRGSTQFHTQHRVATRAKLQYTRGAYTFSSASLSHLILISLLFIVPGFYFTRKQLPIDLVACYHFIIRGISINWTAP
jgi:hypothetical protein